MRQMEEAMSAHNARQPAPEAESQPASAPGSDTTPQASVMPAPEVVPPAPVHIGICILVMIGCQYIYSRMYVHACIYVCLCVCMHVYDVHSLQHSACLS